MPTLKPPSTPVRPLDPTKAEQKNEVDDKIDQILRIKDTHKQILELAKQDLNRANERSKDQMRKFLAQELRGQLPSALENALNKGQVPNKNLQELLKRLANTNKNNISQTNDPALAREMASDPSLPQQALRWTKFVQKAQHVPASHIQQRDGSASPKGSGANLIELLGQNATELSQSAGLRNPKLIARPLGDLSPQENLMLMEAVFGEKMATKLQGLNINDPLSFLQAGKFPEGRILLAKTLNMPKGRLLAYLMRTELLKIGRGKNGEIGIRPDHLKPLSQAGISMLGSLQALRSFDRNDFGAIFKVFRQALGLLPQKLVGGRPIVKRDFMHWARTASRQSSEIYLLGQDKAGAEIHTFDAQELIQAWYLENLLRQELEQAKKQEREPKDYLKREEREQGKQKDSKGEDDKEEETYDHDEDIPYLESDLLRDDNLHCFWITDYNTLSSKPGAVRRMYVCLDPETGAIIPQQIEIIESPILSGQGGQHER
tara:strand:- start:2006 stop:3472 length:1467 start_codon:yes stop_codon:yes gene_type:complete